MSTVGQVSSADSQTGTKALRYGGKLEKWLAFILLVAPALILFAVMILYPLGNMFRVSTLDWRGIVRPSTPAGLDNYELMFTRDANFRVAAQNTATMVAVTIPAVVFPAFIFGFFLSLRPPGYRVYRTIFFSPAMLSAPGIALLFLGVYLPDGILNQALRAIGLENLERIWLGNRDTSLWALIAVETWGGIGFYTILFFAVLSNVPRELYEAARIDGATTWTIMWRIAFPMVREMVGIVAMLLYLWLLLGSAQTVLLLTEGGPGNSSLTLPYYLYRQAFESRNLGYSQAIGVVIFVAGITGMIIIRQLTRRRT